MIEIIYQNSDFLVINKPSGLMVHADGRGQEETLVDFLLEKYPEIKEVGEPMIIEKKINGRTQSEKIWRPGIVHRLDKETSGVMIIAKNQKTFELLKNKFQNKEIEKTYHAFVYGNIKEDEGKIDLPIGRNKNDFRQWQAGDRARGEMREALTIFKVLKRSSDKQVTFLEVQPKTGRTHQIRVHLKSTHHPVVADSLYAPDRTNNLGFKRTALHAYSLKFRDGNSNYEFVAPYPYDFQKALEILA